MMSSCSGEILHGAVFLHELFTHRNGRADTQIGKTQEKSCGVNLGVTYIECATKAEGRCFAGGLWY